MSVDALLNNACALFLEASSVRKRLCAFAVCEAGGSTMTHVTVIGVGLMRT